MELILWRHCDAESGVPDDLRRLTPRGHRDAERMARWLAPRLPAQCRVLVSPAVRAQQTARALRPVFETEPALSPGATVDDVLRAVDWPGADVPTLIVGHEPTLGQVVSYLLTGEAADRPLAKGGVAWLSAKPGEPTARAILRLAASPDSVHE